VARPEKSQAAVGSNGQSHGNGVGKEKVEGDEGGGRRGKKEEEEGGERKEEKSAPASSRGAASLADPVKAAERQFLSKFNLSLEPEAVAPAITLVEPPGTCQRVKTVTPETLVLASDSTSNGSGNSKGDKHRNGHGNGHGNGQSHSTCRVKSFTYESLAAATGGFETRLGRGGCGSVFRGTLPSGTQIAVKRLQDPSAGVL
jgi:hypothetical protein